mgnify:CR=1 FL=1
MAHRAHAQAGTAARGGAGASGSAAVLLLEAVAAAAALLPLGGRTRGSALASAALAVAPPPVAAAHAEHLRALAALFFWLLLKWSGALSAAHFAHRMAPCASAADLSRPTATKTQ